MVILFKKTRQENKKPIILNKEKELSKQKEMPIIQNISVSSSPLKEIKVEK